ncbi:hypothetical protein FT637_21775 [Bacillus cereus]|nr:hypothetical protein [Bacillus cereus]
MVWAQYSWGRGKNKVSWLFRDFIDYAPLFISLFAGSKTPTSKFGCKAKKLGGRSTACTCPIGEG